MKNTTLAVSLACLVLAACNEKKEVKTEEVSVADSTKTSANPPGSEKKEWIPIDSAEGMKAYIAYATPGEAHKDLAKWDGKWTGETTMWETIDGKPTKSTLQATNTMMKGGRYQMSTFKGAMMGMNFEGTGITGYDNNLKKYVSVWVDNMGTGIIKMEGTRDESSKSITYTATSKNPVNGLDCEMKQVLTDIDNNTQKLDMYGQDPKTGTMFKTMEIILKRSK